MATPFITDFGDETHDFGETGLVVDGFDFGFFPGELWMFENPDRSGAADQLTVGSWGEFQLTGVEIPAVPNNAAGAVYLGLKTQENEWSTPAFPFAFTLESGVVTVPTVPGLEYTLPENRLHYSLEDEDQ